MSLRALITIIALTINIALQVAASADDLMVLGDEFGNSNTFPLWHDLGVVEGWDTPSYEVANIDTTEAGRFHIVPGPNT